MFMKYPKTSRKFCKTTGQAKKVSEIGAEK